VESAPVGLDGDREMVMAHELGSLVI